MSQISISSDSPVDDNGQEFVVEEIIARRMNNGLQEYLIKWLGFATTENTWEPFSNLKYVSSMVQDFESRLERSTDKKKTSKQQKQQIQNKKQKQLKSDQESKQNHSQSSQSPPPQKMIKKLKSKSPSQLVPPLPDERKTVIDIGCYDDNDSAKEILNIRKDNENKTLEFYVAWKQRKSNKIPQPTWMADHLLKLHNPEILCDFLLKKIKWPKSGPNE